MSQLLRQLSSCRLLINNYHQGITRSYSRLSCQLYKQLEPSVNKSCQLMPRQNVVLNQYRNSTSVFTRQTAEEIWKGVTSVSKAGKRRGRGKGAGRRQAKDLNKGQILGVGPVNMIWPGLNAPIIKGREISSIKKLPQDKNYLINLLRVRNEMDTYRKRKIHPLDRGWSGMQIKGKWIGPPDPLLEETFEGFDTKVLMVRNEVVMTARMGRTRFVNAMCVTGNKKGTGGFCFVKTKEAGVAVRRAKNKAAQRLVTIDLYEGHTIMHDFVSCMGEVKVYAFKKPKGYRIVAHRVIKSICQVMGIEDIYCKVEGPTKNYLNVTKAFFTGLCNQKSFQQMANEKRLHVVELKPECDYYPRVVASPDPLLGPVRTVDQIGSNEITDFRQYLNEGKIIELTPRKYPYYVKTPGYIKYLHQWYYERNRQNVRVYLKAKYGQMDSFLTVAEKKSRAERKMKMALESPDDHNDGSGGGGTTSHVDDHQMDQPAKDSSVF